MEEILKPILLDETGQVTNAKLSEHTSQMGEALQSIADAISNLGNITNDSEKINAPKDISGNVSNGTSGQILQTNGDGTTQWVDKPFGNTSTGGITEEKDPTVPDWAKSPEKPKYTADEIGADLAGTAESKVSTHNSDSNAHSSLFISKVNTSDIADDLTTDNSDKVLSAAQGVAIKALIDKIIIPKNLANPYSLTFTGAVNGSYDGSEPITINIPFASSDSSGTIDQSIIATDEEAEEYLQMSDQSIIATDVEAEEYLRVEE